MRYLKSSTLVENLVAMTIISLSIGLVMMIFLRLSGIGGISDKMVNSQIAANAYFGRLEQDFQYKLAPSPIEGYQVEAYFKRHDNDLIEVDYLVLDNTGREVYSRTRWYYYEREQSQ